VAPASRTVIQWPSLGPYHLARLRACQAAVGGDREVIGLATAGSVEGRPWTLGSEVGGIRIVVAFPDRVYSEIPGAEAARELTRVMDSLQPTVVGVSGYGMADSRAALDWTRRHGAVGVLMSESKADDAPRRFWKEWIKRWYVSRFGAALCGGTPHRRYLERLGMSPKRIFDKYDVVDNEAFATASADARRHPERFHHLPGLADARPFFLVSSRLIGRKNIALLLQAFATYRKGRPDGWRLVVIGTGVEEQALTSWVRANQVPDVVFAGFHQMEELVGYYALAGVFIHPALQEQWGLVVNEAMACGLPVLVSRTVGAAHDLVEEGRNGFTFDPRDAEQLAGLMGRMAAAEFPLADFGEESRRIVAQWTPEHFGKNFWAAVAAARPDVTRAARP
jgi:1,2-diacylglycerol 3-alpha-glucosyltransferase